MFKRAYQIIIEPGKTWPVIANEPTDVRRLFKSYVLPLILLPIICAVIKVLLARGPYITVPFVFNLVIVGTVNYILYAATILFAGWLVSILAQYFSSKTDIASAMKLVAYAMTPAWLSSVFQIFPRLSVLSILGFYAAYLIFTGLPVVLEAPEGKDTIFSATVVILGIFIMMYLSILTGGLSYI